jgi:hypothetical protein
MTERTHISSSQVPGSAACGQWETLLADALDGLLKPEDEAIFTAHMAACPACTALFEEARRGREWLEFLSPEPEVPEGLLERILAQTGPGQIEGFGLADPNSNLLPVTQGLVPAWQQPGFYGQVRRYAQPRLLMTFAMAFFSIALTLHLTDVRLSGLRLSDLRPAAIRSFMERRITMASTPIIRYYDHLRFVYEVESRMREIRRDAQSQQPDRNRPKDSTPGESQQVPAHKDGGSRMDPPQQSVNPSNDDPTDTLETSLTFETPANPARLALSGGSANARRERSTVWTA